MLQPAKRSNAGAANVYKSTITKPQKQLRKLDLSKECSHFVSQLRAGQRVARTRRPQAYDSSEHQNTASTSSGTTCNRRVERSTMVSHRNRGARGTRARGNAGVASCNAQKQHEKRHGACPFLCLVLMPPSSEHLEVDVPVR